MTSLLNKVLGRFGCEIVTKEVGRAFSLYNPTYLAKVCQPKTVIDIGVGYGTFPLYDSFPGAYFILIEPVEEYKSAIATILAKHRGRVHYQAVGSESGTISFDVDLDNLQLSSSFKRSALTQRKTHRIESRTVKITTLDELIGPAESIERPLVLKIDTEGNELNVLRGAINTLKAADFVILEASISKRFEGSYEFAELITFMAQQGFMLYSIISLAHPTKELRPRFADLLFAKQTA